MGEFYRRQEDWPQTESALKQAIELGARNPWTYGRLGYALQSQGKWEETADAHLNAVHLAHSDESVAHLFCPLSNLLAGLQQDDSELLRKCVQWGENEDQRAWAEQQLQVIESSANTGE